jgi:manganese/zinc/iron transport system substrate-binding protein
MSPPLWSKIISALWHDLAKIYPHIVQDSQNAFLNYMENLHKLHLYAKKTLNSIPSHKRILVTSHDAFGYFGQTYGLGVYGIQGISTQSEASLRHIQKLSAMLADTLTPAVFVETSVSDHYIASLIENVAAKGGSVTLGGRLFSDAMGPDGTYTGTYIGMIDHNVTTITQALGGDAPKKGMLGLL